MIFISKDYKGQIVGIVSASDIKSVNAFYQGLGDMPHITEPFSIEQDRENEEMGYVTPILKTIEVDIQRLAHERGSTREASKIRIQIK